MGRMWHEEWPINGRINGQGSALYLHFVHLNKWKARGPRGEVREVWTWDEF